MFLYYDFNNINDLSNLQYISSSGELSSESRRSGKSVYLATISKGFYVYLPIELSQIYMGCAIKLSGTGYDTPFITFKCAEDFSFDINYVCSNKLSLARWITDIAYCNVNIIPDVWSYIELKVTFSESIVEDDFIIKVDGEEVLNLPVGTVTRPFSSLIINKIIFSGPSLSDYLYIEDLYINTTGFLGDVTTKTYYPNDNGSYSDFVGSDSDSTDNYALVDEATPDTDDYIESGTINNKDLYAFEDSDADTIYCVKINSIADKSNNSFRSVKNQLKIGEDLYEGSELFLGYNSTVYNEEYLLTDPSTSSQWTPTNFNAAQFGIKVHS